MKHHLLLDGVMFQKLSKIIFSFLVEGQIFNKVICYHLILKKISYKKFHALNSLNQEESHLRGLLAQVLSLTLDLMENISMINGLST